MRSRRLTHTTKKSQVETLPAPAATRVKKGSNSPRCPVCKSKFSHDNETNCCKICGLPDEIKAQGIKPVRRWGMERGWMKRRPATKTRRVHKHGVPRSRGIKSGG